MTGQIPDEVRYRRRWWALTAVDGAGMFDPANKGLTPGPLGTGCWRGYQCRYRIHRGRLILYSMLMGRPDGDPLPLFDVPPVPADRKSVFRGALHYRGLAEPMPFTGRLLLAAGYVHVGYLNMGFRPAWLYERIYEVAFESGRQTWAHDRSATLAAVRQRLGEAGLRPAGDEPSKDWIGRTFSLSFDYSWPGR